MTVKTMTAVRAATTVTSLALVLALLSRSCASGDDHADPTTKQRNAFKSEIEQRIPGADREYANSSLELASAVCTMLDDIPHTHNRTWRSLDHLFDDLDEDAERAELALTVTLGAKHLCPQHTDRLAAYIDDRGIQLSTDSKRPDHRSDRQETVNGDHDAPTPQPPAAGTPPGALEVETLIDGHGPAAADGDTLTVHYVLVLADGTTADSSWETGHPFTFTLGENATIKGWEEGLAGARAGERRRLVVGADKAYGLAGSPPNIPPNAPLAFEIDVISLDRAIP